MPEPDSTCKKIGISACGGIIVLVVGYFFRHWLLPAWNGVVWFLGAAWAWIVSGHFVPGWVLILLILCTVACITGLIALRVYRIRQNDWRSYLEDTFFGIVWRWNYEGELISQPVPFCRHCDTLVTPATDARFIGVSKFKNETVYPCEHCHEEAVRLEEPFQETCNKVIGQVDRKLRNGEWRQAIVK